MQTTTSRVAWTAWLAACLLLLTAPAAHAYIDPGSGSLLFQVLVGTVMAVSLGTKVFWRRLTGFFGRRR